MKNESRFIIVIARDGRRIKVPVINDGYLRVAPSDFCSQIEVDPKWINKYIWSGKEDEQPPLTY